MKKSILNFICGIGLLSANIANAQYTVTNGGFETWTSGAPSPWTKSYKTPSASTFTKSTDAHSGSFALQLQNADAQGMGASLKIPKTGTTLPTKLKGFVKYNISANQRARIIVSFGKTTVEENQTSTTFDYAGWVSFSGSSNNAYTPFEIILDYRLIKQLDSTSNGGIDFDEIKLDVESYGPLSADEDFFEDITNPDIKANSFITLDDLSFEGSIANSGFQTVGGIPDNLETWTAMDGKYIPTTMVLSGVNAAENNIRRMISRSTDAHTGNYAMAVNISGADTSMGFINVLFKATGQKELNFSVKGQMGINDSINVSVVDFSSGDVATKTVTGANLTNSYQTFAVDISALKANSIFFVVIAFEKKSTGTYSIVIDDLLIDNAPVGVRDMEYLNAIVASPNPSNGMFTLTKAAGKNVSIYNSLGKSIVADMMENGTDLNIDISSSPKGVYYVNIDGAKTIKVINH